MGFIKLTHARTQSPMYVRVDFIVEIRDCSTPYQRQTLVILEHGRGSYVEESPELVFKLMEEANKEG